MTCNRMPVSIGAVKSFIRCGIIFLYVGGIFWLRLPRRLSSEVDKVVRPGRDLRRRFALRRNLCNFFKDPLEHRHLAPAACWKTFSQKLYTRVRSVALEIAFVRQGHSRSLDRSRLFDISCDVAQEHSRCFSWKFSSRNTMCFSRRGCEEEVEIDVRNRYRNRYTSMEPICYACVYQFANCAFLITNVSIEIIFLHIYILTASKCEPVKLNQFQEASYSCNRFF